MKKHSITTFSIGGLMKKFYTKSVQTACLLLLALTSSIAVNAQTVTNLTSTNTYPTIQAAITAANSGDVLQLSAGTYNEQVNITKSLTLQGDPLAARGNIIIDGTGLPQTRGGIKTANNLTNIKVQHLTVQHFKKGTISGHSAGVYVGLKNDNSSFIDVACKENVDMSGIYVNGGGDIDGITISNCKVEYSGTQTCRGIVIWDGMKTNITIENDSLINFNCCGIELQDGSASGVLIMNNVVLGNGNIEMTGLMAGAGPNIIKNNTVKTKGPFGIEIRNPNGAGVDNNATDGAIIIDGNTIERVGSSYDAGDIAGISVYRRYVFGTNVNIPTGVVIKNNTVKNFSQTLNWSHSTGFGILIEGTHHIVKNNDVSTNNDVGIQVQAGYDSSSFPGDSDDNDQNPPDRYFGKGNTQYSCDNLIENNTTDTVRYVGVANPNDVITVNGISLSSDGAIAVCAGSPLLITASGEPTDSVYVFHEGTLITSDSLKNLSYTFSPSLAGRYYVKFSTPYSCPIIDSFQVQSITQFTHTNTVIMCPGDTYTLPNGDSTTMAGLYSDTLQAAGGCDSIVTTNIQFIKVTAPILSDDFVTLDKNDVNHSIDEQKNDAIPAGSTIQILSTTKNGTAQLQPDGSIIYTPKNGFAGKDSIMYMVCLDTCTHVCDTAIIHIEVLDLEIPQILSPNNDGANDIFMIKGIDKYPKNQLYILDRWGDVLYKASPYKNDWDGTANQGIRITKGKLSPGTYYYVFYKTPDAKPLKGFFEITH